MSPRSRLAAFGSALLLVVAGGACAALVPGLTGEVLAIVLIALGLAGAFLLVFLEVGLSEEKDLARDRERLRERAMRTVEIRRRPRLGRKPRRPD